MSTPRPDTSWHDAFLAEVAEGMAYKYAARKAGVSDKTLYNHFRRDPSFRAKADAVRSPRVYPADTSWHDRLPPLIAAGLSMPDAASLLGVRAQTIEQQLLIPRFQYLRDAISKAREQSGRSRGMRVSDPRRNRIIEAFNRGRSLDDRRGGRPPSLTSEVRQVILDAIRAGATLKEAATAAETTPLTIKRARYRDRAFDAGVVEAGGGRFSLLTPPRCPGPKCGTPYAYDTLGCREAVCRIAAITRRNQ